MGIPRNPTYETLPTSSPLWAAEPFRVFFPLGILASIAGVLVWPLYYWGAWPIPPHLQHPRLMMFGFGGAFVCGFLGTAWPRFLEAEALRRWEVILLGILWVASVAIYLGGELAKGDLVFGLFTLALLLILCIRLRPGRDLPPPGFALALSAVAMVCAASFFWAFSPACMDRFPTLLIFSRLVAFQGMLLLPIMGVGSYLFARFFQLKGARPPTASPRRRAIGVWLSAAIVLISFVVEARGLMREGNLLRLIGVLVWLLLSVPALWRLRAPGTRAWALRIAVGMILLTFAIRSFWPGPGHAIAHLLFLGGFGLTLLLVADRVTQGHGGDIKLLPPRSVLWRWIVWLGLLAAVTRASADMKASLIVSHHIYAALTWVILVMIWLIPTARLWARQSPDD